MEATLPAAYFLAKSVKLLKIDLNASQKSWLGEWMLFITADFSILSGQKITQDNLVSEYLRRMFSC